MSLWSLLRRLLSFPSRSSSSSHSPFADHASLPPFPFLSSTPSPSPSPFPAAYQTVPAALAKLRSAGYKIVSVDTCLDSQGEYPYAYVGEPGVRDDSWHC